MMSLARPLADSARAQTPRYQLPAITWLLISQLPQPLQDFRTHLLRFLSLSSSGLVWTKWVRFERVCWALSVGDCRISSPSFALVFSSVLLFPLLLLQTDWEDEASLPAMTSCWCGSELDLSSGWLIDSWRALIYGNQSQTHWARLHFLGRRKKR